MGWRELKGGVCGKGTDERVMLSLFDSPNFEWYIYILCFL